MPYNYLKMLARERCLRVTEKNVARKIILTYDRWSDKRIGNLNALLKRSINSQFSLAVLGVPNNISCILITRRPAFSCGLFLLGLGNIRLSPQGIEAMWQSHAIFPRALRRVRRGVMLSVRRSAVQPAVRAAVSKWSFVHSYSFKIWTSLIKLF